LTEYTRPATWEDVKTVARHFAENNVEYALVGAYAIAAHGYSRFSEDIDVLVNPSADNSRRWIAALSKLPDAAAAELATDNDVFADDKRYAIRINDEFTIDVMPSIAGLSWEDLRRHITSTTIDDVSIRLLDLEGLLKTKQSPRPKDQMDAAIIAEALRRLKKD
jgi:hypothetical protein